MQEMGLSMIESFYENPWPMLTAAFVLGLAGGLILAAWMIQIYWILSKRTKRWNQAIQEEMALRVLVEQPIEIDEDRMICAICWQERHPGQIWMLTWLTQHCKKHLDTESALAEEEYAISH